MCYNPKENCFLYARAAIELQKSAGLDWMDLRQGETMTRIVFMGTPDFSVPTLQAMAQQYPIAGVVTQPDRPAGRGKRIVAPPVKETALALGLPVYQPTSLRTPEAEQRLAEWQPDLILVAAFGQILQAAILDLPPHGCLNVHASLLPRYRGAAPISAAILNGESTTGVTIMRMDEGMDTGPILAQASCPITADDTTGTLTATLADLGAQLLVDTLPRWLGGELAAQPQDHEQATYCRPLTKEDGRLDWTRPAEFLSRQIRACNPWPGAFTTWQGRRLKILLARPHPGDPGNCPPGQVIALVDGIGVVTGAGLLELAEVQLAGKNAMDAQQLARGQRDFVGGILGR